MHPAGFLDPGDGADPAGLHLLEHHAPSTGTSGNALLAGADRSWGPQFWYDISYTLPCTRNVRGQETIGAAGTVPGNTSRVQRLERIQC